MITPGTPTVLLIGGGLMQVPLIEEAHCLGLQTIVTDANPHAPGQAIAGAFYAISTTDIPKHQALVQGLRGSGITLRGVATAGADVAATVAAGAAIAQTPGIDPEVAGRLQDKGFVRSRLSTIPDTTRHQPTWCIIESEKQRIADAAKGWVGYPVVIKPLSERASRGVTIVATPEDLPHAMARLHPYAATEGRALVEQCKDGQEYSVECVLDGTGQAVAWNECERFFTYDQGIPLERGHVNPPACHISRIDAMRQVVLATANACGIMWGPWKNDLLVDEQGHIWVLECCARLSGGWDCQRTQKSSRGVSLMRPMLKMACGMELTLDDTRPTRESHTACVAISLPAGTIQAIAPRGQECVTWHVKPGDTITPLTHNGQRAGFAFAKTTGGTAQHAWGAAARLAQKARRWVTIETNRESKH